MLPAEVKPQLPKPEIKVKEKILKAEVVEEHVEKTQHLQICEQHDNKASTLVLETTKEVGVLTSCEEVNEDAKTFEVDATIDGENSRASSFQVWENDRDKNEIESI
ncbi:hypothetical protein Tco_0988358 [Tanacetum coccineum]|uniref:Uncharacterized protein n=1 Tax=Tanacetum coccineum TaxID=301880 RepID=A0ABQ5ER34_9ASTR